MFQENGGKRKILLMSSSRTLKQSEGREETFGRKEADVLNWKKYWLTFSCDHTLVVSV